MPNSQSDVWCFDVGRSKLLRIYFHVVHLLAFFALILMAGSQSRWLLGMPVMLLSWIGAPVAWLPKKRHGEAGEYSLLCSAAGQWQLVSGQQSHQGLSLVGARIWPWVVTLEFKLPGTSSHRYFAVAIDACEERQWRQLRWILRHRPYGLAAASR